MALKILITNDDGIYAEGLKVLVDLVRGLGEIVVCAPSKQQSAKSHAIDLVTPIKYEKVDIFEGVTAYAVSSTPADCVRFATYGIKYDYDLLLSGINQGYNLGYDILYSGTVGAAFEGSIIGKKSIALSTDHRTFIGAKEYFEEVKDFIFKNNILDIANSININFPVKAKGIRITRQGGHNFDTFFDNTEEGFIQRGHECFETNVDKIDLDTSCVMNGYVSITPITGDRTNKEIFEKIKHIKG